MSGAGPESRCDATRRWGREQVLAAIRRHLEAHGEPPRYEQWRKAGEGHPNAGTVIYYFGSWSAGIAEAGCRPRRSRGDDHLAALRVAAERYRMARRARDAALRAAGGRGASSEWLSAESGLDTPRILTILEGSE